MKETAKVNYVLVAFLAALIGLIIGGGLVWQLENQTAATRLQAWHTFVKKYELISQQLYLALPIYQDYISRSDEKELRRFLNQDHLQVAAAKNLPVIRDQKHLQQLLAQKQLTALEQSFATPWFFFNVRKENRYVTPAARTGLETISQHFNRKIHDRLQKKFQGQAARDFIVKYAISSAVRPGLYQADLRGRNSNAANESSHTYGISVDIFYDEFYIYTDLAAANPAYAYADPAKSLLGFSVARARRRQLQAMLAETLLELQEARVLYAIFERNQRCYHVTIL